MEGKKTGKGKLAIVLLGSLLLVGTFAAMKWFGIALAITLAVACLVYVFHKAARLEIIDRLGKENPSYGLSMAWVGVAFFTLCGLVAAEATFEFMPKDPPASRGRTTRARSANEAGLAKPQRRQKFTLMPAELLAQAYKDNEISADIRFKDKLIALAGTIDVIGKDILGKMYISLKTSKNRYQMINFVQCFFDQDQVAHLAKLRKGQYVFVMGWVRGRMGNIILDKCRLSGIGRGR